jgi:hypothetical protein
MQLLAMALWTNLEPVANGAVNILVLHIIFYFLMGKAAMSSPCNWKYSSVKNAFRPAVDFDRR